MTTKSQNLYVRILRANGLEATAEQLTELLRLYSKRTAWRAERHRQSRPSWRGSDALRAATAASLADIDAQIAALESALTGGSDDR